MKVRVDNIIRRLVFFSILVSSFDIFLCLDIGGLTFRAGQVAMILAVLLTVVCPIRIEPADVPHGFGILVVLFALNTIFLPRSLNLKNGIGYEFWFMLNILTVFIMVFYSGRAYSCYSLLRLYMKSYWVMAVLGIIQGFLQIFHIYIYVRQINRINGFSYEPSYYSTYMLAGWVMFAYLLEARSYEIVSRRVLYRYFAATSMVLLLSTSKLAWATMAGWLAFRTVNIVFHMILGKVREDKLVFLIILPILAAIGFALILFLDSKWDIIGRYTSGLGLFGSSGHSANARRRQLNNTIGVLKKSPFLGYSYGGVDPAIASYSGTEYKGNGGGMNVLIETAIALGIGGAILFVYFLYEITVRFIRHHRKNHILNAVVLGLLVQFGELMFNQNIQRTYFWISIAMVCVVEKEIIKRNYFYIKN